MLLAPSGFDHIVVLEMGPRHIILSWDPPASPNGILVNYTVLRGGATVVVTMPTTLNFNVTGLLPFAMYNFSVTACSSVGCVGSQLLVATTMEDGKKHMSFFFVEVHASLRNLRELCNNTANMTHIHFMCVCVHARTMLFTIANLNVHFHSRKFVSV